MKKRKKKLKKMVFVILAFLIIEFISTAFFIKEINYYNASKSNMKYIVYGAVFLTILLAIIFLIRGFVVIKKNKKSSYAWYTFFIIITIAFLVFASYNINKISKSITAVTGKYTTYSTSIIALKASSIDDVNDLKNKKIGIISDTSSVEGYIISMEIVKQRKISKENLVSYDDYDTMLQDLYDEKISAAFVSSAYKTMFSNTSGFEDIGSKVKVILSKKKIMKKKISKSTKTLTEPFTVLIMGVDSEEESLKQGSSFNGDSLILMTFNPETSNATILSIPRDTYVPISCKNNVKGKINSASYGGEDCMIKTIENLTDVNIDYWVKVNFKGVVKLVNALGGIDIDVPYAFCEQNSDRVFGSSTIYVEKGYQTLNGEQALAFARNRHTWPQYCGSKYSKYTSNDFIRGQNQQKIITAMLNKVKKINSLSQVYKILNIVGDSIDTNIDKETMITGFDTFEKLVENSKNINNNDFIGIQKLYLSGYDKTMNNIYYYMYYKQSLQEIKDAMNVNLGIDEPEITKEFDFSINETYTETQIGKGTYSY